MTASLIEVLINKGEVCAEFDEGSDGSAILAQCRLGGLCIVVDGKPCKINPAAKKGYCDVGNLGKIALPVVNAEEKIVI